ncbi:DUF1849 family protein [uncultured Gammaproteobacteria bacterium]
MLAPLRIFGLEPAARSLVLAALIGPLATLIPQPASAAGDIVPHRAIYKLSPGPVRNGSGIADVRGSMLFEWADACDGWTIVQHFRMTFLHTDGEEVKMATNYATWESRDGRSYRYTMRKLVNGELNEEVRGEASVAPDGGAGSARFLRPEAKEMPLPAGTLFPTTHTIALLGKAMAGEKLFNRTVFDGADADGVSEINAVISDRVGVAVPLLTEKFKDVPAWPVRMAFFPLKSELSSPEYEMSMTLLRNGIAESMKIDYGDFTVQAVLDALEMLPASGC